MMEKFLGILHSASLKTCHRVPSRLVLAYGGEGVRDGLAALQKGVQPVRLLFQEFDGLHLHPEHHPHLTLQAGELICRRGTRE